MPILAAKCTLKTKCLGVLTEYEGEGVFAEVEPLQGGGAGGRGEGQEVTSPVLPVGNHRHLIAAAGQEVSQADLDVLPGGLLEGDVLAVDDPG